MTNQEIINSPAFKLLNHMIDEKLRYIQTYMPYILVSVQRSFSESGYKTTVCTRTSQEGEVYVDLPAGLSALQMVAENIQDLIKVEEEIHELQRQKLRLLNDYDYTRGDDSEQKKIFGDGNAA